MAAVVAAAPAGSHLPGLTSIEAAQHASAPAGAQATTAAAAAAAPTAKTTTAVHHSPKPAPHGATDTAGAAAPPPLQPHLSPRESVLSVPVPEDAPMSGDSVTASPFQHNMPAAAAVPQRRGLAALFTCSCFGGGAVDVEDTGSGPMSPVSSPSVKQQLSLRSGSTSGQPLAAMPSRKVSRRTSSLRRWGTLKRLGSNAYSDADWFDAVSKFDSTGDDRDSMLAEVDQLVKELGDFKGPWIPDPPLAFAVANMQYTPLPERTGFAAWWERDDDRTTPPPQPIDVMLKASWITQKSHNSIPGVWMEENDKDFVMTVKPKFVPPGFPRYVETYDKTNQTEPSWALRRDLKTGRSYGKIYWTADGTLIFRVWTRPMFSNEVDIITEEYMRLEEGGNVLVARQCCLDVKSGKRAVQYLVGRRHAQPPRGGI